jgi:hypothetical protein
MAASFCLHALRARTTENFSSRHWCEISLLAAAHFHGFGVARQGPWNTWVNRGKRKGRGVAPRPG